LGGIHWTRAVSEGNKFIKDDENSSHPSADSENAHPVEELFRENESIKKY